MVILNSKTFSIVFWKFIKIYQKPELIVDYGLRRKVLLKGENPFDYRHLKNMKKSV